jgi:hypothetical protein
MIKENVISERCPCLDVLCLLLFIPVLYRLVR